MPIKVGETVPNFNAQLTSGKFDLTDYKGKYVVLYFYPKDNTPGCTLEANDFVDFYDQFKALNAEIVGVSRDSVDSHKKFCSKQAITYPLIADTDSKICDLFGVIKQNSIFGKTALGLIRSTFLIDPNGKLLHEWRKVKVEGHVQEVLNVLKAQK